jgi:hypothetical protein
MRWLAMSFQQQVDLHPQLEFISQLPPQWELATPWTSLSSGIVGILQVTSIWEG